MYNTQEMIDNVIVAVNDLFRLLISNNYVGFCAKMVEVQQMLAALKKGTADAERAHRQEIAALEGQIEAHRKAPDGGGIIGGGTVRINGEGEITHDVRESE